MQNLPFLSSYLQCLGSTSGPGLLPYTLLLSHMPSSRGLFISLIVVVFHLLLLVMVYGVCVVFYFELGFDAKDQLRASSVLC